METLPLRSLGEAPEYPWIAQRANVRGVVVLELSVDANGAVTASRALNDLPLLAPTAVAHSKTWQAYPRSVGQGIVVYEFTLDDRMCEPGTRTILTRVTYGYVRLSVCTPMIDVATPGGA